MQPITIAGRGDNPVRILEVIGNASMGGMENYIKNFIANLPDDEFRVTCICPYESPFTDSLRQLGVEEVFITPIADDPEWRSIQLTAEVARLHKIDVLHAHMPKAHVLAGLAGCLIHKPVVATVHGMNVTSHELGVTRAVSSHLITNCQEAYTQALAMGVPAERVGLVRNGVDLDIFTPGGSGVVFRKAIDVPDHAILVGFVGRLEPEKGPDLFLRAAEYIHQELPDVHFVIVGEGGMNGRLNEMCSHMRLEDYVHFVGWWRDTPAIYPALDLLAHTSRSDGTSLVLLEAMACGCPTVGLAVGGVREIIENECTGLLAGAGDWEGAGIRIIQLLQQPERLKNMGTAARARIEKYFNVATNTHRTAEILRRVAFTEVNNERFSNNSTLSRKIGGRASLDTSKS
jgi:glycosyltransferase involved in cell wall biosynthesis